MSGIIGEAFVRIRPQVSGAEVESGFKSAFKDVAKIVGTAFATEKVFKFGEEIVKSAANTKRATETIRQGFGAAGDAVTKFNEGPAAQLGISAEAGQTAAAKFATLFGTLDIGKGKAADMTVNLEKMAGGLAQIKGVDPSDVLDKLYAASTGATRGLKSLGIVIDGNTIKQKAAELGLVTHVKSTQASETADRLLAIAKARLNDTLAKYGPNTTQAAQAQLTLEKAQNAVTKAVNGTASALTPAQKTQAIYAALMDKLAGVQKAAAGHSDDLANSEKRLQAQWSNLKDELGSKLLPIVETVVGWFADKMPGALKATQDKIQEVADRIRGPFTGALDKAKSILEAVADALKATVKFMIQYQNILLPISGFIGGVTLAMEAWTVATEVWTTVTKVATAAQKAFDIALDANLIGVIVLAIAGLIGALVVLYQRSNTVRQVINTAWTDIEKVSQRVWGGIKTYVLDAFDIIKTVVVTDLKVIRDIFNVFKAVFTGDWAGAWRNVKKIFSDIWDGMGRVVSDVLDIIKTYVEKKAIEIALKIIEPFTHLPGWLGGGWAKDMKSNLQDALAGLNQPAAQGGTNVGTMFGQNAVAAANPFLSQLQQSVTSALSGGGVTRSATSLAGNPALSGKSLAGEDPNLVAGLSKLAKAGYDVAVTSAKRTFAQQTALWNRYVKSGYSDKYIAAMPGTSDHEKGLAADVLINGKPAASYGASFLARFGLTAPLGMRDAVHLTALGGRGQQSSSTTGTTTTTTTPAVPTALTVGTAASAAVSVAKQIAAAKASLEASYKKIVASAKDLGGELTGTIKKDMASVRTEITGISSKSDVTAAKKNLEDLRAEVSAKLKQIRTEIALNATFDGLKTQVKKLGTDVTPEITAQMKRIQSEIGKVSTPQQIADLKAQMTRVKNEIATQLAAIKARVQTEQASFNAAWGALASGADAAFQKATNKALQNMQIAVTGAFGGFQFGGSIIQTPAEAALAKLQADHDAAAASAKLAADQAQLAIDLASGDLAAIAASQAAVDDDMYTSKVAALQAQATLERNAATQQLQDAQTAYQDQRTLLQQQLDQRVQDIETGMLNGSIAAGAGMQMLTDVLNDPAYGIDMQNSGLAIGGALYKGLNDGLKPVFDLIQKLVDDMRSAGLLTGNPTVGGNLNGTLDPAIAAALRAAGKPIPGVGTTDTSAAALAKTQAAMLAELKKQTELAKANPTVSVSVNDQSGNRLAKAVAR